ncbi:GIY-YIG nuclease family protein [uncultured Pseudodesulfovibrio sp.]|uniref:GIY-YIG nuclease family protein n=1 Tax=uncultured Pseudodesulfovibrio sp. TaxID=2035858 RepID=UPI0029C99C41|nr:GIY-YIG nuclease family protein [uncultured Pseudodesulfovibrio sp.]
MSNWYVYLIRCADDTLYCGITSDIERRLKQHNAGTASKYTRSRLPALLETFVQVDSKSDALKLEIQVKKQNRNNKIAFLHKAVS